MSCITPDFYHNIYGGSETEDNIELLIKRAEDILNSVTGYKLSEAMKNDGFIKEQIKLAVAAETDYLDRNGGLSALDSSTPVQMTLGHFSYMNGAGTSERRSFPLSSMAVSYLEPTGLLSRSIGLNGGA